MKFGLNKLTIEKIHQIFAQFVSIDKVLIYGSRAMGNYKIGSDIDLTLIGDEISHKNLLEIRGKLDELSIPYTVDLSIYSQIDNPELREHIQRVGMVFYTQNT